MKTCDRTWCEEESYVPIGSTTILAHRAVVATVAIAGDEVGVVLAAVDNGPASVLIETREQGSTATTVVTSTNGADACALAAGLLNAVDLAPLPTNGDDRLCDVEATRALLREGAEAEAREHGDGIWTGPFDEAPLGLAHLVTSGFTVSDGCTESAATWLLSVLGERHVETGHIDREIAREIADVLGPDAVQVVGGWVERAQRNGASAGS